MLSITVNGRPRTLPAAVVPVAVGTAVEKNGEIVPRSRYAEVGLAEGDRIEIVGAVGGG